MSTLSSGVTDLIRTDPDVAAVFAVVSASLFDEVAAEAPTRVLDVGIAEQCMIGVAAGLAMTGFRPIVHTITPFLVERPYEQIKDDLVLQRLPGAGRADGRATGHCAALRHGCRSRPHPPARPGLPAGAHRGGAGLSAVRPSLHGWTARGRGNRPSVVTAAPRSCP
jgi:hypothetical protein